MFSRNRHRFDNDLTEFLLPSNISDMLMSLLKDGYFVSNAIARGEFPELFQDDTALAKVPLRQPRAQFWADNRPESASGGMPGNVAPRRDLFPKLLPKDDAASDKVPPRQPRAQTPAYDRPQSVIGGLPIHVAPPREPFRRELFPLPQVPNHTQVSAPGSINIATAPLGPFEVQHKVLIWLQAVLEEACFDFAVEWLIQVVEDNDWTCAAAVELDNWASVLSEQYASLPSNATTATNASEFSSALQVTTRVRNAAVHRTQKTDAENILMIEEAIALLKMLKYPVLARKVNWTLQAFKNALSGVGSYRSAKKPELDAKLDQIRKQRLELDGQESEVNEAARENDASGKHEAIMRFDEVLREISAMLPGHDPPMVSLSIGKARAMMYQPQHHLLTTALVGQSQRHLPAITLVGRCTK